MRRRRVISFEPLVYTQHERVMIGERVRRLRRVSRVSVSLDDSALPTHPERISVYMNNVIMYEINQCGFLQRITPYAAYI